VPMYEIQAVLNLIDEAHFDGCLENFFSILLELKRLLAEWVERDTGYEYGISNTASRSLLL
jgi:hypothetical protein